jgi:glycosyltransferase involved in cell wall biosynthesis
MKISYAVTVCNEFLEIQRLITFLLENKRPQDEIVVQMDLSLDDLNSQPEEKNQVFAYIMKHQEQGHIKVILCPLNGHFADFKNHLTNQCSGDYIFQIDADEIPNENLIAVLPELLKENNEIDVFLVPRVNTVEGLTLEHIAKWGWRVNDEGWVNWPDYQWRIWKNKPEIQWINKVHERLDGFKMYTAMPDVEYFALYHPKTIEKQEKQNQLYDNL